MPWQHIGLKQKLHAYFKIYADLGAKITRVLKGRGDDVQTFRPRQTNFILSNSTFQIAWQKRSKVDDGLFGGRGGRQKVFLVGANITK